MPTTIRVAAALPVRSFTTGKARLAPSLSVPARQALVRALLTHVAETLQHSDGIDALAIVSDEPVVLAWARERKMEGLLAGGAGLKVATRTAQDWAVARKAEALLIVLPDLPLLTHEDVDSLLDLRRPQCIVLAPDRHGSGTNALLLQPPDVIPTAFGPDSLAHHLALASERDIATRIVEREGWGFDLDTPADLEELGVRG